jgi:hypothetical protein
MCTLTDGTVWILAGTYVMVLSVWGFSLRRVWRLGTRYNQLYEALITRLRDDLGVAWDPQEPQ